MTKQVTHRRVSKRGKPFLAGNRRKMIRENKKIMIKVVFSDIELRTVSLDATTFLKDHGANKWDDLDSEKMDAVLQEIDEYESEYTNNAISNMSFKLGKLDFYSENHRLASHQGNSLLDIQELTEFTASPIASDRYIVTVGGTLTKIFEVYESDLKETFGVSSIHELIKLKPKLFQITFGFTTNFEDRTIANADKNSSVELLN